MVTGQLADTPTRGLPTRGLDDSRTGQLADAIGDFACLVWEGVFCGLRNAESCQRVICGNFDADFFLRNESMQNVTEMNIY